MPVQHRPGYCEKIVATCINIITFYRRDIRHSRQSCTCFNSASIRTGPDLSVSEAAPVYTGCLDLFCFQHWEKSLSVWLYVCFDPIPSERRTLSLFICFPDWPQMTHAFSKHKFHSFGSFSTFHYYCAQKDFTQKVRCSCVIVQIRCHLCGITWNVC